MATPSKPKSGKQVTSSAKKASTSSPSRVSKTKSIAPSKVALSSTTHGVNWRSLYLYAVSLITLLICLFAVYGAVRNSLNYILPDPGYVDPYASTPKVDTDAILKNQMEQTRRSALRGILDSVVTLLITIPLYLFHWRKAQTEKG